jgi:glycosyltransferase involved in cell wall biosynthesis
VFKTINSRECKKLARLTRETNIKTWLIPTPIWPELVERVSNPIVVCPDVVITQFPVGFDRYFPKGQITELRTDIRKSFSAASHLIVYSKYVKNAQVVEKFFIDPNKISTIPHGVITLDASLKILQPFHDMRNREKHDLCLQIVHDYLIRSKDPYLRNFDFTGVRFIFYTSQIRPSKNISTLIKA